MSDCAFSGLSDDVEAMRVAHEALARVPWKWRGACLRWLFDRTMSDISDEEHAALHQVAGPAPAPPKATP